MTATGNQRAPAESSDDQQWVLGDTMFSQMMKKNNKICSVKRSCTVNPNPANIPSMLPAEIPGHCIRLSAQKAYMLPK